MLPPENPPPYSKELQTGHITLMKGAQIFKDTVDTVDEVCVSSEVQGAEPLDMSMASGEVSIMNTTSEDTSNREPILLDSDMIRENLQCVHGTSVEYPSGVDSNEGNFPDELVAQNDVDPASQEDTMLRVFSNHNDEAVNEDIMRHSVAASTAYIHFYRPMHRSLSADHSSSQPVSEQLRVPNPRPSQSMAHPAPLSTPFPPKVTLPPITRAPKNISHIITEGWVPNEQFARRPSRLPPLRKRNRVATWHGENSIVAPSTSINSM